MKKFGFAAAALAAMLVVGPARPAFAVDGDGDGYDSSVDCNDGDPSIHPGATEIAGDEIDQNCDGGETCYADADGDGYRSDSTIASTDVDCRDLGEAVATAPLDCDDSKSSVHPGAVEVCDPANTDEDCNGFADDDDLGATGKTTWYADNDRDGYGGSSSSLRCDPSPPFTSTVSSDCDDSDPGVNPGATELVGDEVDEDCDGGEICYADADGDTYRSSATVVSTDVDCRDTGEAPASAPLDCDDTKASVHPGAVEVCDPANTDEDCNG